jgi:hypothetical protein
VATIIIFSLPTEKPVTTETMNFAPVTLAGVLLLASMWYWVPGVGARSRYQGPKFDMEAFERDMLQQAADAMAKSKIMVSPQAVPFHKDHAHPNCRQV